MRHTIGIMVFVVATLAFYTYVGLIVPQVVTYPPESIELSEDMTPDELAVAGARIMGGKGTCLACHTIGSTVENLRFPDLGNMGVLAASRVDSMSGVAYLSHSMYAPDSFIVEGFLPGMPAINQPPIGLNDQEIIAVVAYLQSLGAEPTVTLQTELPYRTESLPTIYAVAGARARAQGDAEEPGLHEEGRRVFAAYLCATCHAIDAPTRLVGPSLYDVGSRLTRGQIYEAILDPDATLAEGYVGALMIATLNGVEFFTRATPEEIRALVAYLAAQTLE